MEWMRQWLHAGAVASVSDYAGTEFTGWVQMRVASSGGAALGELLWGCCSGVAGVIYLDQTSASLSDALRDLVSHIPTSKCVMSDLEVRSLSMLRFKATDETVRCQEGRETKWQFFRQDLTGSLDLVGASSKCLWVLIPLC